MSARRPALSIVWAKSCSMAESRSANSVMRRPRSRIEASSDVLSELVGSAFRRPASSRKARYSPRSWLVRSGLTSRRGPRSPQPTRRERRGTRGARSTPDGPGQRLGLVGVAHGCRRGILAQPIQEEVLLVAPHLERRVEEPRHSIVEANPVFHHQQVDEQHRGDEQHEDEAQRITGRDLSPNARPTEHGVLAAPCGSLHCLYQGLLHDATGPPWSGVWAAPVSRRAVSGRPTGAGRRQRA